MDKFNVEQKIKKSGVAHELETIINEYFAKHASACDAYFEWDGRNVRFSLMVEQI